MDVYDIDQSVAPSARTSSFRNTTIYGSLRLGDASLIVRPSTTDVTISQFELSCLDNLQGNIQTHIDKMTQIFSDVTFGPNLNRTLGLTTFTLTNNGAYDVLTAANQNFDVTVKNLTANGSVRTDNNNIIVKPQQLT